MLVSLQNFIFKKSKIYFSMLEERKNRRSNGPDGWNLSNHLQKLLYFYSINIVTFNFIIYYYEISKFSRFSIIFFSSPELVIWLYNRNMIDDLLWHYRRSSSSVYEKIGKWCYFHSLFTRSDLLGLKCFNFFFQK